MARWLRILLTAIASAIGAYVGLLAIGGGAAGFAWIFLFGDDPWPRWSEIVIPVVALAGAIAGGILLGRSVWYSTGKARS